MIISNPELILKIFITVIGRREFLTIEDVCSIPVDTITKIDLSAENGAASSNSVCVHCGDEKHLFSFESADLVREFLLENKVEILGNKQVEWNLEY